jgi:hypothetical protein
MKKFSHYILSVLDSLFARKFFYKINLIFLKLFIRFLGFNNHKDMKSLTKIPLIRIGNIKTKNFKEFSKLLKIISI